MYCLECFVASGYVPFSCSFKYQLAKAQSVLLRPVGLTVYEWAHYPQL